MNNENKDEKKEFPSELRYDAISGDWVVVASGRAKRPELFKSEARVKEAGSPDDCPFCDYENIKNAVDFFEEGKKTDELTENWSAISIPNKFPAFSPSKEIEKRCENDLFCSINAVGFHEVVITRDHYTSLGEMSQEKVEELISLYKSRYIDLKKEEIVNYISIFHNHGKEAGASIAHPHSQIITTPLLDADLKNYFSRTKRYYEEEGECIHCNLNRFEMEKGERVVYENDAFLAVCPFASKTAFQTVITPKKHLSYFENITEEEVSLLADAFKAVFSKIYKGLNNPPYNFYLHCAPLDDRSYDHHHWHWTVMPKTATWAGFELGAKMEISTIRPEDAAKYLREQ